MPGYFHQYLEIVVISLPYLRKTAGLGYGMVDSRHDCETLISKFETKTLNAEYFEIMVQTKLNKMTKSANGS